MLRRLLFLVAGVLALVVVLGGPGRAHAQHSRGGSHHGTNPGPRRGFTPGFRSGSFDPRFSRNRFERFESRRFDRFEDRLESRRFDRFEDRFENRFPFGRSDERALALPLEFQGRSGWGCARRGSALAPSHGELLWSGPRAGDRARKTPAAPSDHAGCGVRPQEPTAEPVA